LLLVRKQKEIAKCARKLTSLVDIER